MPMSVCACPCLTQPHVLLCRTVAVERIDRTASGLKSQGYIQSPSQVRPGDMVKLGLPYDCFGLVIGKYAHNTGPHAIGLGSYKPAGLGSPLSHEGWRPQALCVLRLGESEVPQGCMQPAQVRPSSMVG